MDFYQHIYTSDPKKGYQTVFFDPELEGILPILEEECLYKRPVSIREVNDCPIKYKTFLLEDGRQVFTRSVYVGKDYHSGRPGNFCSHSFISKMKQPLTNPYSLFRQKDIWVQEYNLTDLNRRDPKNIIPSADNNDAYLRHNSIKEIFSFLVGEFNRLNWYIWIVSELIEQFAQKPPKIILMDRQDQLDKWMYAIVNAFPPHLAKTIFWSSYANPPQYGNSHISGIVPENGYRESDFGKGIQFVDISTPAPNSTPGPYLNRLVELIRQGKWERILQHQQELKPESFQILSPTIDEVVAIYDQIKLINSWQDLTSLKRKYRNLKTIPEILELYKEHCMEPGGDLNQYLVLSIEWINQQTFANPSDRSRTVLGILKELSSALDDQAPLNISQYFNTYFSKSKEPAFLNEVFELLDANIKKLKVLPQTLGSFSKQLLDDYRSGKYEYERKWVLELLQKLQNSYEVTDNKSAIEEIDNYGQALTLSDPDYLKSLGEEEKLDQFIQLINLIKIHPDLLQYESLKIDKPDNWVQFFKLTFSDEEFLRRNEPEIQELIDIQSPSGIYSIQNKILQAAGFDMDLAIFYLSPSKMDLKGLIKIFDKEYGNGETLVHRIEQFSNRIHGKVSEELFNKFINSVMEVTSLDELKKVYFNFLSPQGRFRIESSTDSLPKIFTDYFKKTELENEDKILELVELYRTKEKQIDFPKSYTDWMRRSILLSLGNNPSKTWKLAKKIADGVQSNSELWKLISEFLKNSYNEAWGNQSSEFELDDIYELGEWLKEKNLYDKLMGKKILFTEDLATILTTNSKKAAFETLTRIFKGVENNSSNNIIKSLDAIIKKGWSQDDWSRLIDLFEKRGIKGKRLSGPLIVYLNSIKSKEDKSRKSKKAIESEKPKYSFLIDKLLIYLLINPTKYGPLRRELIKRRKREIPLEIENPKEIKCYIENIIWEVCNSSKNPTIVEDFKLAFPNYISRENMRGLDI